MQGSNNFNNLNKFSDFDHYGYNQIVEIENKVKKSLLQKNFFLLCLAFVLTAVAPLRALALPSAAMSTTCSMVTRQAEESQKSCIYSTV
jgi:hypothetical protein